MNTITTTAFTETILAIDLGKYKSVACLHVEDREIRFATLETTRAELHKLMGKERPAVVIIEACLLAGWVHDLCAELGVRCLVANTASEAWKFKHLKRKTDKDDALRLAQLYLLGQLPTVTLPPVTVRQWRSLIACRQTWVGRRVAVQNRIRALFVAQGLPAPRGAKAWSETGLAGITLQAKTLADCGPEELWRGLLELALTEYRQICALIAQAETRLRRAGQAACRRRPVGDGAGSGTANRRGGSGVPERCGPLQDGKASVGLQRSGAAAASVGRAGPSWPHHQARSGSAPHPRLHSRPRSAAGSRRRGAAPRGASIAWPVWLYRLVRPHVSG
jgi:transposase